MQKSLLLKRSLLICLLPLVGWQVYNHGQGGIIGEQIKQQPESLPYAPVSEPYRLTADTLTSLAEKANEAAKFEESEQLALRALAENLTSSRPASHLLSLYASQKRSQQAGEVADIAGKLWPAHTYTHSRLADYWAHQQRMDKLVPEWNILLTRNPGLRPQLFPVLLEFAKQAEYAPLLKPYIEHPPLWWNSFFDYLCQQAEPELLQQIYQQRLDVKASPPEKTERTAYVNRLLRDKQWQNAYAIWRTGIPSKPQQTATTERVFDGGFEGETANTGFDWQMDQSREVSITPDRTYGMKGQQALHIHLKRDNPVQFQHLSQRLLLPAGDYQLSMRYRLDSLKNTKGLRWRIRCLDAPDTILAESHLLNGQKPWDTLTVAFTTPPMGCEAQLLRLEADGTYLHDHTFAGNLWFDNVSIQAADAGENRAESP
jgi:hypothetical protein